MVKRAIDAYTIEPTDGRFVFVDVTPPAAGSNPEPEAFRLTTGTGTEITPRTDLEVPMIDDRRQVTSDSRTGDAYQSPIETAEGLMFDVPAATRQELSLSVANRFTLPLPTVAQDRPQFTVESVTFPTTVSGGQLSIDLTVSNTGAAGKFRAAVNVSESWYAAYTVERAVPADTKTTVTATIPNLSSYSGNPPKITVETAENTYTEAYDSFA